MQVAISLCSMTVQRPRPQYRRKTAKEKEEYYIGEMENNKLGTRDPAAAVWR